MDKRKAKRRTKGAKFTTARTKSSNLDSYKYDSKPGVIMSDKTANPNRADSELRRMMGGDVFRSADKTVKQSNSNKRRYA